MTLDPTVDRTKRLHASDVGAILGLNPYSSPLQVWLDKMGLAPPRTESRYARLGNRLESAVAEMYAEETGLALIDPKVTLYHPTAPLAGTPDRYAFDGDSADVSRIVEIKTAWTHRSASAWGEPGTDDVPLHYRSQGMIYLALAPGVQRLDFALFASGDLKIYTLWRDDRAIADLVARCSAWWERHVVAGVEPDAACPNDVEMLRARWSESTGEVLQVGDAFDAIAAEYLVAQAEESAAADRASIAKARLQAAIADADGIEGNTFRATWKFAKVAPRVDWEAVAKRCGATPDIVKEYTRDGTPSRRFLLKEK